MNKYYVEVAGYDSKNSCAKYIITEEQYALLRKMTEDDLIFGYSIKTEKDYIDLTNK